MNNEELLDIRLKFEKYSFIFNLEKKLYFNYCYFVFD